MSGVISFGETPGQTWSVSGWAFRRLLTELKVAVPAERRYFDLITQADIYQHLDLPGIAADDLEMAETLRREICAIAREHANEDVSAGRREDEDKDSHRMYLSAMRDLLSCAISSG